MNHCYQKALEDLRGAQESWRTACFDAIASTGDGGQDMTAWMAIQRRARRDPRPDPRGLR